MRGELIKPGMTIAIPANVVRGYGGRHRRGNTPAVGSIPDVNRGFIAAPAKVIAVGRFRWRQSGACAREVADDNYVSTVHVRIPDVPASLKIDGHEYRWHDKAPKGEERFGYPAGLKLTANRITWVDEILSMTQAVMPWDDFLKRHAEWQFVQSEMEAYNERLRLIADEVKSLAVASLSRLTPEQIADLVTVRFAGLFTEEKSGRKSRMWRDDVEKATHVGFDNHVYVPTAEIPGISPLIEEAAVIRQKLSCVR